MINKGLTIKTDIGSIGISDSGYGEMAIVFFGARKGERAYENLSKEQVKTIRDFFSQWLGETP